MASDRVAFELDPTDPEMLKRTVANMASGNVVLPEELPCACARRLNCVCGRRSVCNDGSSSCKVTLHLLALRDFGVYPGYGSERLLAGVARALKKPITSLETPSCKSMRFAAGMRRKASPCRDDAHVAGIGRVS